MIIPIALFFMYVVYLNHWSAQKDFMLENVFIKCQHGVQWTGCSWLQLLLAAIDETLLLYRFKASHMAGEKEIWEKIGEGFVQEYYHQFDNTNRMGLGYLYVSLFSFHLIIVSFCKV